MRKATRVGATVGRGGALRALSEAVGSPIRACSASRALGAHAWPLRPRNGRFKRPPGGRRGPRGGPGRDLSG